MAERNYAFQAVIEQLQAASITHCNHTADAVREVLGTAHAYASFGLLSAKEMEAFLIVGQVLSEVR